MKPKNHSLSLSIVSSLHLRDSIHIKRFQRRKRRLKIITQNECRFSHCLLLNQRPYPIVIFRRNEKNGRFHEVGHVIKFRPVHKFVIFTVAFLPALHSPFFVSSLFVKHLTISTLPNKRTFSVRAKNCRRK